jgi:hypothetical protein
VKYSIPLPFNKSSTPDGIVIQIQLTWQYLSWQYRSEVHSFAISITYTAVTLHLSLVDAGLFRSVTAAAENAIYKQMMEDEKLRLSSISAAIAKGEVDIQAGRTVRYKPNLMAEVSEKGKQAAIAGKPAISEVKP